RSGLGALHRHSGMCFERFRNKSEKTKQRLPKGGCESIVGVGVITEEWRDHIELQSVLDRFSGWIERRTAPYCANRALELVGVHRGQKAIVVEIIKRFVDAIEVLEVGEDQELALGKSFGLVHRQRPGGALIIGLSRRAECEQHDHNSTGNE